jgi:hypothetical protein
MTAERFDDPRAV